MPSFIFAISFAWFCNKFLLDSVPNTYSILLYSILFYSILFYSFLFYSILFCYLLFYSILFYSILFHSISFHSILFCSTVLFYSVLIYYIIFYTKKPFHCLIVIFHSSYNNSSFSFRLLFGGFLSKVLLTPA